MERPAYELHTSGPLSCWNLGDRKWNWPLHLTASAARTQAPGACSLIRHPQMAFVAASTQLCSRRPSAAWQHQELLRKAEVRAAWLSHWEQGHCWKPGQLQGNAHCPAAAPSPSRSSSDIWSGNRKWYDWPSLPFSNSLVCSWNESDSVLPNSHEPRVENHPETRGTDRASGWEIRQKPKAYKGPSILSHLSGLFISHSDHRTLERFAEQLWQG